MHRIGIITAVLFATLICAETAQAQVTELPCVGLDCLRPYPEPSIDPTIWLLRQALVTRGRQHPIFGPAGANDRGPDDRVALTLRFWRRLDETELRWAAERGVEWFRRADGTPRNVGAVYGAVVPFDAIDGLRQLPLRRAEAAWNPVLSRPLETTSRDVGAVQARLVPPSLFDGSGRTIVDIDSSVDVLHPHFFRPNGGRYQWVDVDGDGVFQPGVDTVDLDGDGEVDRREILRVLDAAVVDFQDDAAVTGDDDVLQPRRDWLYADLNGDRERNAGPEAGFTEEDPGYGEPIFVVDDVDRDGVLEPGEPLYMLGTSKIARLVTDSATYIRGENLIDAAEDSTVEDSFHGTGVGSILVGGQRDLHDRVGLAPGADLVVFSTRGETSATLDDVPQLRAVDEAVELGADAVLHEWTNPYTAQHDGSTNLNAAMDAARAEGVLQLTPVGNMNLSGKHLVRAVTAGEVATLEFDVSADGWRTFDGDTLPYTVAYSSLFWRGDQQPDVYLVAPGGDEVLLQPNGAPQLVSEGANNAVVATLERSDRGTTHLFFTIYNELGQREPILAGEWSIRLENVTIDEDIWARVADFYSGWARGIAWSEPTVGFGTGVYPSTADSAFGIGAYAGRVPRSEEVGELRDYSGRGPRIDGARLVDITAPDDPIAALAALPFFTDIGYGRSWFTSFGGTSGSGPHVAAAVVMLRQQDPQRSADEIESAIVAAARTNALVPAPEVLPDEAWGYGKLDIFAALFGASPEPNRAPVAVASVSPNGIDATESSDPDGDPLEYRFDVDNDGSPEADWTPAARYVGELPTSGFARVDVRDSAGARAGVLLELGDGEGAEPDPNSSDAGESDVGTPPVQGRSTGCCSTTRFESGPAPVFLLLVLMIALRLR